MEANTVNTSTGITRLEWDLNDLWLAGEGESWRVEHDGYGSKRGEWILTLDFSEGARGDEGADAAWVQRSWQFYGATVDQALTKAVEWCSALVDLAAGDLHDG